MKISRSRMFNLGIMLLGGIAYIVATLGSIVLYFGWEEVHLVEALPLIVIALLIMALTTDLTWRFHKAIAEESCKKGEEENPPSLGELPWFIREDIVRCTLYDSGLDVCPMCRYYDICVDLHKFG